MVASDEMEPAMRVFLDQLAQMLDMAFYVFVECARFPVIGYVQALIYIAEQNAVLDLRVGELFAQQRIGGVSVGVGSAQVQVGDDKAFLPFLRGVLRKQVEDMGKNSWAVRTQDTPALQASR